MGQKSWQITLSFSFPMLSMWLMTVKETYSRQEMSLEDLCPGKEVVLRKGVRINPNTISLIEGEPGMGQNFHGQFGNFLDPGYSVFSDLHVSSWDLTTSIPTFWSGGSKVRFTWGFSARQQANLVLGYPSRTWTCTLITYSECWIQIFPDILPEAITAISYKNTVLNTRCG